MADKIGSEQSITIQVKQPETQGSFSVSGPDRKLEPGETFEVTATIQNSTSDTSYNAWVQYKGGLGNGESDHVGIPPGESRQISMEFKIPESPKDSYSITMDAYGEEPSWV